MNELDIKPEFPYPPDEISAFGVTMDVFILSLKNGELVHHTPEDEQEFHQWLTAHEVREV